MISYDIDPKEAKINIQYINRVRKELGISTCNIQNQVKLENLIFSNKATYKNLKKMVSKDINELKFNSIMKIKSEEYYPTKEQADLFVNKINKELYLSDDEKKRLSVRYIHSWQVSRTTKIPSYNILLNLIELFKEDSIDESLLVKMTSYINEEKVA